MVTVFTARLISVPGKACASAPANRPPTRRMAATSVLSAQSSATSRVSARAVPRERKVARLNPAGSTGIACCSAGPTKGLVERSSRSGAESRNSAAAARNMMPHTSKAPTASSQATSSGSLASAAPVIVTCTTTEDSSRARRALRWASMMADGRPRAASLTFSQATKLMKTLMAPAAMKPAQHRERHQVDGPHHVAAHALGEAGERVAEQSDREQQRADEPIEDRGQQQGRFTPPLLGQNDCTAGH